MLKLLPAELTFSILQYLHVVDVGSLADAVMPDRSLYRNVTLPCLTSLEPVLSAARRRAHFEQYFGTAQDFATKDSQELWNPAWARELVKPQTLTTLVSSRRMRHEHSTAFLRLDGTLQWMPPTSDDVHGLYGTSDYLMALTVSDAQILRTKASQLQLTIPESFFTFMSDDGLMERLPHCFWLLERGNIGKACDVIDNGRDGYVMDFCHEPGKHVGAYMWSLWLQPGGSHCVVRRQIPSGRVETREKPAAQLVATSFELWLASEFYAHWKKCGVDFCCDAHWWLDKPLVDCLSKYVHYNCIK